MPKPICKNCKKEMINYTEENGYRRWTCHNPKCKKLVKCKLFFILLISLFIINLVHASDISSLGTFSANSNITLTQNCVNNTYTNITSIYLTGNNPIQFLKNPASMTNSNGYQNYTFTNTSNIGDYIVTGICDQNSIPISWSYSFTITSSGNPQASGNIVLFFIIAFLILIGLTFYLSLYSLGHVINKDLDIVDLSLDWGLFFVILSLYFLENFYLGNKMMNQYLLWFISIGGIMLILVPFIGFIISLVNGAFNKQNPVQKFRVPRQRYLQ
jgi:hypothetical protein